MFHTREKKRKIESKFISFKFYTFVTCPKIIGESVFHTHINEKNNHKIQPKFLKFKFNTYIICLKIIKLCLILKNFQEKKRKKYLRKIIFIYLIVP